MKPPGNREVGYLGTPELWKENPVSNSNGRSKVFSRLSPTIKKVSISVYTVPVQSIKQCCGLLYFEPRSTVRLFTRKIILNER
jgi:hypothetical protein